MRPQGARGRLALAGPLLVGMLAVLVQSYSARADTVVVNGRTLKGEIVEETSDTVVLRSGAGTISIPRRAITSIVREDEASTLLSEARALARNGDRKALDIFARAIEARRKAGADAKTLAALEDELAGLEKRLGSAPGSASSTTAPGRVRPGRAAKGKSGTPTKGDPFLLEEDLAQVAGLVASPVAEQRKTAANKLLELGNGHLGKKEPRWALGCLRLALKLAPTLVTDKRWEEAERETACGACGGAIRDKDWKLARAAIQPDVERFPLDVRVAYLDGRVHELSDEPDAAAAAYRRVLEGRDIPDLGSLAPDLLAELVRGTLHGRLPSAGSPGWGPSWKRAETAHLVFYHQLEGGLSSDQLDLYEQAWSQALSRLGLTVEDVGAGRTLVFLFGGHDDYQGGGGIEWAAGHTLPERFDDGPHALISTYAGRDSVGTIEHELAHVFVAAAFEDVELSSWGMEGSATYAETDRGRGRLRQDLHKAYMSGTLPPLADFLAGKAVDTSSQMAIRTFYARSYGVFTALVDAAGGAKAAVELAARIAKEGPDTPLKDVGLTLDALEEKVHAIANATE